MLPTPQRLSSTDWLFVTQDCHVRQEPGSTEGLLLARHRSEHLPPTVSSTCPHGPVMWGQQTRFPPGAATVRTKEHTLGSPSDKAWPPVRRCFHLLFTVPSFHTWGDGL